MESKNSKIEKIKDLNFPLGEYVVVGSSILEVLGIRESVDIDIAVTSKLRDILLKTGKWNEEYNYNKLFLKNPGIDILPELNWEKYDTTTNQAIAGAIIIDGIPFMNLEELIKFKTALGREKDFKDIELIRKYLNL